MTNDLQIADKILAESRVIAVVGISPKPDRPSHYVAKYLQSHGYRIIPVNPVSAGTHILGEHCYATLTQAAAALAEQQIRIDLVDVFRKSELVEPIADEAIAIKARAFWLQMGIINEAATNKARAAGLDVVADRCTKVDHARWRAQQA
ncbi:CoA-binding protein [Herminiimonas sp. KBW02]|uniref:CoA-binding protein n=1 Tax=Herminiimonas sp. KBW02 TaxID=2153363 RepID=UPI000F58F57E|nr:CoA-binding protein [Herminiimonas sp. KBW02]RQO37143.1 CoA-binding protein [Herminiimonas sp. KBW02]